MHHILTRTKVTKEDNFSFLLFGLIFLLFSSACVDQFFASSRFGQYLIIALTIISMLIGLWSFRNRHFAFKTSIGIVLATLLITTVIAILDKVELEFIHLLLMLVFFTLSVKLAFQQALFSGEITINHIVGSICIFLLLGLIWAVLYLLLMELIPVSFSGIEQGSWKVNFSDFIYFSFVTLTTLGFGDLLPKAPLARFLVYMEAVVGVFYMAIVVSSLVGAALNSSPIKRVN
ncbi:MAG TPA: ion channel [Psychromonas sp.]